MIRATVLIPSHDHGRLLSIAAASALAQTITELEVFIVLDGADSATARAADEVAAADTRVRLFVHAKGARHGEAYRHIALQEAQGRIVCYLSDDDIWFPDHVEYLDALLQKADFAHSQTVVARPDGDLGVPHHGNLEDPWFREWLTGPHNFIPLSAAGHTLTAYRSLAVGWSPAPADVWTDLYMWRKFLAAPDIRYSSGGRPTVIHFPSPSRTKMTPEDRFAEMRSWWERLQVPGGYQALRHQAFDGMAAQAAALVRERSKVGAELERVQSTLATTEAASLVLRQEREALLAEAANARFELTAIQGSLVYRAGRRVADIPVIGRIGRWVAAALVGRRGR